MNLTRWAQNDLNDVIVYILFSVCQSESLYLFIVFSFLFLHLQLCFLPLLLQLLLLFLVLLLQRHKVYVKYCKCQNTHNDRHINTYTYVNTSITSVFRLTFKEPYMHKLFHQCTCRRRSCSCCHLSRRVRSSLGSQTQWLTRLAKFNMGVSIYPDPINNHAHTCIRTKRTEKRGKVRGQVWLQSLQLQEMKGQDRVKFKNEGGTEIESWSCSRILTVTLLSSSPSVN